jgi:hypothetical protein
MSTDARSEWWYVASAKHTVGAGMTENPYEPPQTDLAPAPVVKIEAPEEPQAGIVFRLAAIAISYLILMVSLDWRAFSAIELSWDGLNTIFNPAIGLACGLFWAYLGLTGRMPRAWTR